MEARIIGWKERIKEVKNYSEAELEKIQADAMKREEEKRLIQYIQCLIDKVPARFKNKIFADYLTNLPEQERVKAICERFVLTFHERLEQSSSVIFLGTPGTGKTLLSLIMYQALVYKQYIAHYEPTLRFLKVLQEKRFESSVAYKNMLDFYVRPHFLILDEITESTTKDGIPSEMEVKLLFELINERYMSGNRCTLVISNRDKKNLIQRLGNPIVDRLSENGLTLVFNWNSYRKQN